MGGAFSKPDKGTSGGGIIGDLFGMFGLGGGKSGSANTPDGTQMNPLAVMLVDQNGNLLANLTGANGTLGAGGVDLSNMLGNGFGSSASSGIFGGFNPLSLMGLIPGLAEGGDVSPGKAYIVGEKHPELFVPGTSGRIVPNFPAGTKTGDTVHQHISINGVQNPDDFRRSQAQIGRAFSMMAAKSNSRG
jgi:hypothetical protein